MSTIKNKKQSALQKKYNTMLKHYHTIKSAFIYAHCRYLISILEDNGKLFIQMDNKMKRLKTQLEALSKELYTIKKMIRQANREYMAFNIS